MGAFDVITVGTDSSGRPVKMTRRMWQAYQIVDRHVGGALTIVQGAFQGTGGADASAGTHAQSGCLDIRTWNLTTEQRNRAQRKAREIGWAAWYRTAAQGFDPHMHWLLLGERPMHADAQWQATAYRNGRNGLASNGPDDFWRPDPIPTYQYRDGDTMADYADQLKQIDAKVDRLLVQSRGQTSRLADALRETQADLDALADTAAKAGDVAEVTEAVRNQARKTRDKITAATQEETP